ncbi:cell cycle checkpoint control protein RAD9A-like [Apostichopus japonicus]|uniref:cell cycle checkpoint control protein RAD9A-like n=1 Tax=Stichopus japonicus TaxID=307972 RepID=UPI003AB52ECB
MKCLIPGSNLKVFGKTVHALSRFGDDIYLEPLEKGLALKTVNSSRSAFAYVLFSPAFFIKYQSRSPGDGLASGDEEEESFRCRITAKSCLRIFKSPTNLEKNVDRCLISLDAQECRLIFQLNCRHGITKTFSLTYQETETLQAVFAKELSPNHIIADSRALGIVSTSFKPQQEEVTMTVNPTELSFRNYVEDEAEPGRVTHSELKLPPQEFSEYRIGVDTEVTFCLKEFKAILSLSDTVRLPLNIRFETTGKPIVFSFESEGSLEGTFVLATLADIGASQSSQQTQPSTSQRKISGRSHTTKPSASSATTGRKRSTKHADREGQGERSRPIKEDVEFPDETGWHPHGPQEKGNNDQPPRTSAGSPVFPVNSFADRLRLPPQDMSAPQDISTPQGNGVKEAVSEVNSTFLANFMGDADQEAEEHRLRTSPIRDRGSGANSDDDDDDFDFVPNTPPSKKFKSMFFGSTQSQAAGSSRDVEENAAELSKSRVLAADSDSDDDD